MKRKINYRGIELTSAAEACLDYDTIRGAYYTELLIDREGSRYRAIYPIIDIDLDADCCCDWQNPAELEYLGD